MKKIHILLTGGGSGGHIYPLIAVAQKLRELAARQSIEMELQYMGPENMYTAYLVRENITIVYIANAKLRRYFSLHNVIDAPKFLYSIIQALIKVALFRPSVVFSKGGPGALSVLIACRAYGIPIIIHESDSVPGITNRVTGKWARIIELAWESAREYFPNKDTRVVGVPLREELVQKRALSKHDAKTDLRLDHNKPVILIVGGSQGSQRINNFIVENLGELLSRYHIIHQAGSMHYEECRAVAGEQKNYFLYAYLEENMGTAYAAADCVLSRSGSVVFEIAAFGKPSIVIPLPEAANDHQRVNAYEYAHTGAAIVIEENNLTINLFLAQLEKILDPETHKKMSVAANAFSTLDAAHHIARDIISFVI